MYEHLPERLFGQVSAAVLYRVVAEATKSQLTIPRAAAAQSALAATNDAAIAGQTLGSRLLFTNGTYTGCGAWKLPRLVHAIFDDAHELRVYPVARLLLQTAVQPLCGGIVTERDIEDLVKFVCGDMPVGKVYEHVVRVHGVHAATQLEVRNVIPGMWQGVVRGELVQHKAAWTTFREQHPDLLAALTDSQLVQLCALREQFPGALPANLLSVVLSC